MTEQRRTYETNGTPTSNDIFRAFLDETGIGIEKVDGWKRTDENALSIKLIHGGNIEYKTTES